MKFVFLQLILCVAGSIAFAATTSSGGTGSSHAILSSSSSGASSVSAFTPTSSSASTTSSGGTGSSHAILSSSSSGASSVSAFTPTSSSASTVAVSTTSSSIGNPVADPNPNAALASVISQWATENQWNSTSGSHNLPVLLIPTAVGSATVTTAPVQIHLGCGFFEVETVYSSGDNTLKNCTVFLQVPLWGRTVLLGPQDVPLNAANISVGIPGTTINGTIRFFLDSTGTEVIMGWVLNTPFAGMLDESGLSVLTAHFTEKQLQGVRVFSEAEVQALAGPRPDFSIYGTDIALATPTEEQRLLQSFINDFVNSTDSVTAIQTFSTSASQYTVDVSFLNIFQVSGSVDPASLSASITLYVNIPLAGRVSLTKVEGSLITGITASINVVLATGKAVLSAQVGPSGKHDLYIQASLSIRFVGDFNTPGNFRILTLP
ncbi:hypothetical protein B0H13DRAFT_2337420 [Mycena leptocephala]|nr:hypothetical protein B0H13DRAFT_2337420 [Mycena leptocephala]